MILEFECVHGELQIVKHFVDFASLPGWAMREPLVGRRRAPAQRRQRV